MTRISFFYCWKVKTKRRQDILESSSLYFSSRSTSSNKTQQIRVIMSLCLSWGLVFRFISYMALVMLPGSGSGVCPGPVMLCISWLWTSCMCDLVVKDNPQMTKKSLLCGSSYSNMWRIHTHVALYGGASHNLMLVLILAKVNSLL